MSDLSARSRNEYEIRLLGHLDDHWRGSFPQLELVHCIDVDGAPLTILRGSIVDEAELHGLLARIRDLGIPLLLVSRRAVGREEPDPRSPEAIEPSLRPGGESVGSH